VLQVFRNYSPYAVIILFLFAIGFKLGALLHPVLPVASAEQVIWQGVLDFLHLLLGQSAFAFTFFALINSFGQALYLNKIAATHHLFNRATYLPALTFLLISSLVPQWNYLSAPLIGNWLLLMILSNTLQLYGTTEPRKKLFNIGCFISIAAFLHTPYFMLAVAVLASLALLRPFKAGEWVIAVLGIITPIYFLTGILFLVDKISWLQQIPEIDLAIPRTINMPQVFYTVVGIMVCLGLFGAFTLQNFMSRMLIQPKKLWGVTLLMTFLCIVAGLTTVGSERSNWLVAVPLLSLLLSAAWMREQNKWISSVLFYCTIAALIYIQWFAY
jgi:hypothetical protein